MKSDFKSALYVARSSRRRKISHIRAQGTHWALIWSIYNLIGNKCNMLDMVSAHPAVKLELILSYQHAHSGYRSILELIFNTRLYMTDLLQNVSSRKLIILIPKHFTQLLGLCRDYLRWNNHHLHVFRKMSHIRAQTFLCSNMSSQVWLKNWLQPDLYCIAF